MIIVISVEYSKFVYCYCFKTARMISLRNCRWSWRLQTWYYYIPVILYVVANVLQRLIRCL